MKYGAHIDILAKYTVILSIKSQRYSVNCDRGVKKPENIYIYIEEAGITFFSSSTMTQNPLIDY